MGTVERNYYDVLGVPHDADNKTIKNAYHRLAMKLHPDRNPAPDAEEKFKEIAKAYAVLIDPKKRARYDAQGVEGIAHFSNEDLFRNIDLGSIFGDLGFGFGPGGNSIFDRFYHHAARPARGSDIRIRLQLPLEFINKGGHKTVRFNRPIECKTCHGFGTGTGKAPPPCGACNGTGHSVVTRDAKQEGGSSVHYQQVTTCPECNGSGHKVVDVCKRCNGTGKVDKSEKLKIDIPVGIEDGMTLRIAGHGMPGEVGGQSGDLLVLIYSESDPRFQRRGADLWRAESIDIDDAVLGKKITMPTLHGDVEVTIPAGTQADEILRLKGKGLNRFRESGTGDLNVRIQIHIPKTITPEEKALFERLRVLKQH